MALAGKKAKILAYSSALAFTDEATTTTDDTTYQITNTNKRIWCKTCTITVKDGGVPTVESYTVDRLTGRITFTSAVVRTITVTGSYLPVSTIGCAYEYSWNLTADNVDSTCFENEFMRREQALKDLEADLSKFYDINHYFIDLLMADGDYVLEFYSNASSSPDIRAWTKISSDNPSAAVDGLVEESISFEGTTDADNRCASFGPF